MARGRGVRFKSSGLDRQRATGAAAPEDVVEIWISLAATSVGRGWDSVGYRAGAYRNRIELEACDREP